VVGDEGVSDDSERKMIWRTTSRGDGSFYSWQSGEGRGKIPDRVCAAAHSDSRANNLLGAAGQTSPKPLQPPNLLAIDGQCGV
jgi:hypothetical protein